MGLFRTQSQPLTRLNLASLDLATLSHKRRGEEKRGVREYHRGIFFNSSQNKSSPFATFSFQ